MMCIYTHYEGSGNYIGTSTRWMDASGSKGQPCPVQASDQEGPRDRASSRTGHPFGDIEEHRKAVRSKTEVRAVPHYIGLIHKDADSDFGVSFPDLPGVVTAGTSLDDARLMAEEALALH